MISESEVLSILGELVERPPDPKKGELTVADAMRIFGCRRVVARDRLDKLNACGLFDKRRYGRMAVYAPTEACTPKALREAVADIQALVSQKKA